MVSTTYGSLPAVLLGAVGAVIVAVLAWNWMFEAGERARVMTVLADARRGFGA
jgi:hypothetical protein